jgi:hypothetical protein
MHRGMSIVRLAAWSVIGAGHCTLLQATSARAQAPDYLTVLTIPPARVGTCLPLPPARTDSTGAGGTATAHHLVIVSQPAGSRRELTVYTSARGEPLLYAEMTWGFEPPAQGTGVRHRRTHRFARRHSWAAHASYPDYLSAIPHGTYRQRVAARDGREREEEQHAHGAGCGPAGAGRTDGSLAGTALSVSAFARYAAPSATAVGDSIDSPALVVGDIQGAIRSLRQSHRPVLCRVGLHHATGEAVRERLEIPRRLA